jgi:hypothetical protein
MPSAPTRASVVSLFALNLIFVSAQPPISAKPLNATQILNDQPAWLARNNLGTFARKLVGNGAVCLEATGEQATKVKHRDPNIILTNLTSEMGPERSGLKIILRGTSQLNSFPTAIEALKRAAAQWETLIQSRVTIVIDVDFGLTVFGSPFADDVVSTTETQVLEGNALYPGIQADLISRAFEPETISLYNALPTKAVPTTEGMSTGLAAPTATLRALEVIDQTADPAGELSSFGLPPAIALNSKFKFDFDSSNGIEPNQLDFEAIVSHEIGHILGFISCVGQAEVNSSVDPQPSIWDLFRVRPEAINGSLTTAQRVLTVGGEQSFFGGDSARSLSTGRPDGSGGDGRQSAHWKDDNLSGRYIGIMDPTIGLGDHYYITDNDIAVLKAIGYQARSVSEPPTLIPLVSGQPQNGAMIAPPPKAGVLSHLQYSIRVLSGAEQLKIELNGNQDVDLFARFGQRVFIQGFHPESDYVSAGDSGVEAITITPASSPPLRAGTYFIAVANFGPGDADFTVEATVTGGKIGRPPTVFDVNPHLDGDVLSLNYAAVDLDKDAARVEFTIVDGSGRSLAPPSRIVIGFNTSQFESQVSIGGLSGFPEATSVNFILVDREGNRSPEATVNFGSAEAGGITLIGASFADSRLTIRTGGLDENLAVEINGRVVAPPRAIKIKGAAKLIIKADSALLGLRSGPNRIRVKNGKGWSNILVFIM